MNENNKILEKINELKENLKTISIKVDKKIDKDNFTEKEKLAKQSSELMFSQFTNEIKNTRIELRDYFKSTLGKILGIGLPVLAVLGFFGVPYLFQLQSTNVLSKHVNELEQITNKLDSLYEEHKNKMEKAAEQRNILLASDYGRDDSYVVGMRGRILGSVSSANIAEQIELNEDPMKAAAQLLNAARNYPAGTVIGAVYNPGAKRNHLFIAKTGDGFYYVGPKNELAAPVLNGLGGAKECVWLNAPPGRVAGGDRSLKGQKIIGPTVAMLSAGHPADIDLSEYGSKFKCGEAFPVVSLETEGAIVLQTDKFGNCLTSLQTYKGQERFFSIDKEFEVIIAGKPIIAVFVEHLDSAKPGNIIGMNFDGRLNLLKKDGKFIDDFPMCEEGANVTRKT